MDTAVDVTLVVRALYMCAHPAVVVSSHFGRLIPSKPIERGYHRHGTSVKDVDWHVSQCVDMYVSGVVYMSSMPGNRTIISTMLFMLQIGWTVGPGTCM